MVVALKPWQRAALALLGTLIGLAGAGAWVLSYAFGTCGPFEIVFTLVGLGILFVAVAALWVYSLDSDTGRTPQWLFGAVLVMSLYAIFGRPPGC